MGSKIGITMRMQICSHTNELRNALADDWISFIKKGIPEITLIPILNHGKSVCSQVEDLELDGLILSGGDDWGIFPIRDETEETLCNWAYEHRIPILGICRGMQVLNIAFGGNAPSATSDSHISVRHKIDLHKELQMPTEVNSYHSKLLYPKEISPLLHIIATAKDGSVEAVGAHNKRILGVMWHPEREENPHKNNIELFYNFFRIKK